MHKPLLALILLVFFLAVPCFAESGKSSDPVLSASPGKSIVGRSLPPGTYRVVPVLRTGQREAYINVMLIESDSGKSPQVSDQSKTGNSAKLPKTDISQTKLQKKQIGKITEPDITGSPQKKIQKKQTPQKKPDEPTGTGPEFDCEYGLPRRAGANCEIQLTSGDLPQGWRIDPLNMNQACVVNQWVLYGPGKTNRIEINISAWNPRAEKYYNWKHGMLATGQYNQTDLPIGNKQLYVEEKNGCNKQLIMQVGIYLIDMQRPPVEGKTQTNDPIKRKDFVAVAKSIENRIANVAGIPPRDVMNGNPTTISWRSVVWPVRLHNGAILQVKGAGTGKWGSEWRAVASGNPGIVSWNGIGTGRGPVIVYQRTNNVWTLVLVDYATGALRNIHNFNQRVTPMSGGEYGATIRSGDKCYDYSWNHLTEISCKSKNFIFGAPQSSTSGTNTVDTPVDGPSVTVGPKKPETGQDPGGKKPDKKKNPPKKVTAPIPPGDDYPLWLTDYLAIVADHHMNHPPWTLEFDEKVKLKLMRTDTKMEFSDVKFVTINDFGELVGNTYHATKAGSGNIGVKSYSIPYDPKGGGDYKMLEYKPDVPGPLSVHVNPPLNPQSYWPDEKDLVALTVEIRDADKGELIQSGGVLVSLQGANTPEVTKTAYCPWPTEFRVRELSHLPPAIYTIYVYRRAEDSAFDLHAIKEYKVALPIQQGSSWHKVVFVDLGARKWPYPLPKHLMIKDKK